MSLSVREGSTRAVDLFVEARETRTGIATPGLVHTLFAPHGYSEEAARVRICTFVLVNKVN
jgi:hypothetical protein